MEAKDGINREKTVLTIVSIVSIVSQYCENAVRRYCYGFESLLLVLIQILIRFLFSLVAAIKPEIGLTSAQDSAPNGC